MKRISFILIALIVILGGLSSCNKEITIKYDANGGTGLVPATRTIKKGESSEIAESSNLQNGALTFKNWNTKTDGTGDEYLEGKTYFFNEDITLYAYWEDERISAPTNVRANRASAISIEITWNIVREAKFYKILRSNSENGEFTQIGSSENTFYLDDRLNMNADYYYIVVGISSDDIDGKPSDVVKGTTKL
ncbi:MAG: InlB B-repeat-containing protein [Bacteroidales bacterium]|nr:InlB B-repeat-containing protein [Bacteroidales bacterium]